MSDALIFPVGHYLGENHPGATHVVRIGRRQYELESGDQLAMWALAHGVPSGPASASEAAWTRTTAEAVARAGGISAATTALDDLLGRDLLVEVVPGTPEAGEFARACRVRPLLVGSGEHPTASGQYGLGAVPANPTARVDGFTYQLWMWGHVHDSLWHACETFARAEPDSDDANAEPVLDRLLPALQVLLTHGAAYLDEAH